MGWELKYVVLFALFAADEPFMAFTLIQRVLSQGQQAILIGWCFGTFAKALL